MNGMNGNFFCMIDGGIIYQVDTYNKVPIGYTNEVYNSLNQTTDEYYNRLVELGEIVPPKTQEEINAELQKALKESQAVNLQMLEIIQSLKGGDTDGRNSDSAGQKSVSRSKSGRSNNQSEPSSGGEVSK